MALQKVTLAFNSLTGLATLPGWLPWLVWMPWLAWVPWLTDWVALAGLAVLAVLAGLAALADWLGCLGCPGWLAILAGLAAGARGGIAFLTVFGKADCRCVDDFWLFGSLGTRGRAGTIGCQQATGSIQETTLPWRHKPLA